LTSVALRDRSILGEKNQKRRIQSQWMRGKMHHREGFAASGGLKEYANKL
jgi:hypothetical protein